MSQPITRYVLVLLASLPLAACGDSSSAPRVSALTGCPAGAELTGAVPPAGLRQRCQKAEGVRHGASQEWYEGGRPRAYSEWWDGSKHGRFTLWFANGKVRSQGAHRHGAPAGTWTYYNEDGSVRQSQAFPVVPPAADWLVQALAGKGPTDDEVNRERPVKTADDDL